MRISDWSSDVCSSDLLAGCAESKRDSGGGGDKFVFAGSAEPVTLDPFFASDGESFRVSRQIFEGLVGTKPGPAAQAPLLAQSWETSEDGLTYTFTLEDGVPFQAGTDFNTQQVCRSEECRVGKECVSAWRSRSSPYHKKQKKK